MENQPFMQKDEIDLSRYVNVLIKHKVTFIVVFLFSLVVGIGRVAFSPKVYKIAMIIQLPIIEEFLAERNPPNSISENLKFLILNNAFNGEIFNRLGLDPSKANLDFEVSIPSNTNLITISIYEGSKDKELGKRALSTLYEILSRKYSSLIQLKNDEVDNEIKIILNNITNLEENVNPLEDRLKEIDLHQEKLYDEIKSISTNTVDLVNKRDILLKNASKDNEVSSLLYSNTIQLNLGYVNQLNNQLADFKSRAIDRRSEIQNLKTQINNYQIEINKLKLKKQLFSNLKILKEPDVSRVPLDSSRKGYIVTAIFLGLILAIVAVFLKEYLGTVLKIK